MEHVDAKVIRERLNVIAVAITTLESNATPAHVNAISSARQALKDVALMVTGDELDEHGQFAPPRLRRERDELRREENAHESAEHTDGGRDGALGATVR